MIPRKAVKNTATGSRPVASPTSSSLSPRSATPVGIAVTAGTRHPWSLGISFPFCEIRLSWRRNRSGSADFSGVGPPPAPFCYLAGNHSQDFAPSVAIVVQALTRFVVLPWLKDAIRFWHGKIGD